MVVDIIVKTCMICCKNISLFDHNSGLVFNDEHFVCEDCASKHSDEELSVLTRSIMRDSCNGMPIGLWLIHEQNKDKTMMAPKK